MKDWNISANFDILHSTFIQNIHDVVDRDAQLNPYYYNNVIGSQQILKQ